jgi:hypothetical protein
MSTPTTCCPACNTPISTAIPGPEGDPGADGSNGINAFTLLTDNVTIPEVDSNVTVSVADSTWMGIGQIVFLSDGTDFGHFEVISLPASTSATLQFKGFNGDASPAAVIASGGTVSPSGTQPALAAPLPTAFTDNSGGTPSDTIAVGVGVSNMCLPLTLPTGGTTAADAVTSFTPGYKFEILSFSYVAEVATAGASASRDWNLEIGSTDVGTPEVLTVSTANSATVGTVLNVGTISANNTGSASDTISLEVAAGGTTYTGGSGYFLVRIKNVDLADAIASLADHTDDLIVALT